VRRESAECFRLNSLWRTSCTYTTARLFCWWRGETHFYHLRLSCRAAPSLSVTSPDKADQEPAAIVRCEFDCQARLIREGFCKKTWSCWEVILDRARRDPLYLAAALAGDNLSFTLSPFGDTDGSSVSSVSLCKIGRFRRQTSSDTDEMAPRSVSHKGGRSNSLRCPISLFFLSL